MPDGNFQLYFPCSTIGKKCDDNYDDIDNSKIEEGIIASKGVSTRWILINKGYCGIFFVIRLSVRLDVKLGVRLDVKLGDGQKIYSTLLTLFSLPANAITVFQYTDNNSPQPHFIPLLCCFFLLRRIRYSHIFTFL